MNIENKISIFINTTLKKDMRIFTKTGDVYIFEKINFQEGLESQFYCHSFNNLHQSNFKTPNTPSDVSLAYSEINWEQTILNN